MCWQVCIFAVYVGTGGKLLSEKGCPSSDGKGSTRSVLRRNWRG